MYTEVIQDSVIELMKQGKCRFGSTCALTLSNKTEEEFFNNIDFFRDKVIIRPAEISNSPEIARRLGIISMNTAIEADIFGNVNSTHITGIKMMNGIGRLHPQRLYLDLLVPLDNERGQDLEHRSHGQPCRPF